MTPLSSFGLMSVRHCEQIDAERDFSLPAVIETPEIKIADRFACVETPLIQDCTFSFRRLAEMSRKGDLTPIPMSVANGETVLSEAIALHNAALATISVDYRGEACERLHSRLKLAVGGNSPDTLFAYLPCLSILTLFNLSQIDRTEVLDQIEVAGEVDEKDRLAVWMSLGHIFVKCSVVLHFCRGRLFPYASMSLRDSMQVKAWWTDWQRLAKRCRQFVPPEFDGQQVSNGGVKRLHDVVRKSMLTLDQILQEKRRGPLETMQPEDPEVLTEIEGEVSQASAEPPRRDVVTKVQAALRGGSLPGCEVRHVISDPEALREDKGLRKATTEGWSPAALDRLLGGVIARPLQSEAFVRLAEQFPHAAAALESIARSLRLAEAYGRTAFSLVRPLLLIGQPGTGKTFLAKAIAAAAGVHSVVIPLGGADSKSIAGSHRSWSQSLPSIAVQALGMGAYNPFVILDEVDKVSTDSRNGNAIQALLPLLERATAASYRDQFLCCDIDASGISYVLTSNSIELLPAPLISRCEVVHLRMPEREFWPAIIANVRRELAEELAVDERFLPALSAADVEFLCSCEDIQSIRTLAAVVRRMLEHESFENHRVAFH